MMSRQDQGTPVETETLELGSSIADYGTHSATGDTEKSVSGGLTALTGAANATQANGRTLQCFADTMTAEASGIIATHASTPITHVVYQHDPHTTGRPQDTVMCTVHSHGMPVGTVHSQRANPIGSQCVHMMQGHGTRDSSGISTILYFLMYTV